MGRILVADDDASMVLMLTDILSSQGHEVLVAQDGLSLLEKAKALKPDLLIVDIMMPRVPGTVAVERLQADPDTAGIPVIILTATLYEKAEQIAPKYPNVQLMFKPMNLPAMMKAIANALAAPK